MNCLTKKRTRNRSYLLRIFVTRQTIWFVIAVNNRCEFDVIRAFSYDWRRDAFDVSDRVCRSKFDWRWSRINLLFYKNRNIRFEQSFASVCDQVLIHEHIADSIAMWKRFAKNFCNDLSYQLQSMLNVLAANVLSNSYFDYELYLLNLILFDLKKTLTNFRLLVNVHQWNRNVGNSLIARKLNYDMNLELRLKEDQHTRMNAN